jgi:pimeloyl-ACP methyl ester carboxylesterase
MTDEASPHPIPRALACLGLAIAVVALLALAIADRPLWGGQRLTAAAPGSADANVRLAATYYPGTRSAGVLLLEGFGSDQVTMRSIASEFARAGVHVMTLDFSGHGRSPGGLGFDNAETDVLARQVLAARAAFEEHAGLAGDRIILLGHSMGARVALQAAVLDQAPTAGLMLLGTQVNLATNVQSEFFTGVRDADLPWVNRLAPGRPATPILLLSGAWDDILTPDAAHALHNRLSFQPGDHQGDPSRTLEILPALLHPYEVFAPRAISRAKAWAGEAWGIPLPSGARAPVAALRIWAWIAALCGMLAALALGRHWLPEPPALAAQSTSRVTVTHVRRFLWVKLALWVAAIPAMALCSAAFFVVPLPLPAFNMIYVGFIGGYGLLMRILYSLGRMPGAEGRWPLVTPRPEPRSEEWSIPDAEPFSASPPAPGDGCAGAAAAAQSGPARPRWLATVLLLAGVLALATLYARSGWFFAPPAGSRMAWLLLFTPPTALGFWTGAHEGEALDRATGGRGGPRLALSLTGLVPFFLWAIFQLAIGSLSGVVGSAQGLIVLALALLLGARLRQLAIPPWWAAVAQSVLLYWLILPQGSLFVV